MEQGAFKGSAFEDTSKIENVLSEIGGEFGGKPHELIPMLQRVQKALGYLPERVLLEIARLAGVPESRVFAVATFYAQFRFTPIGRNHVMLCRGTACHVRGAPQILREIKKTLGIGEGQTTSDMEFSLETVACIGACGLAPNMVVNNDTHGRLTKKRASEVLTEIRSKENGGPDDEQQEDGTDLSRDGLCVRRLSSDNPGN